MTETEVDEEVELGETNDGIQIRDDPPYQKLQAQPCLTCRKRVCHDCGVTCSECHRRACNRCKNANNLNSLCKDCRDGVEDEAAKEYNGAADDEAAQIMIARNEWICRSCFDRQPHECSCGNPSYDPRAPESESDEDDSDNDNWSNYDEDEEPVDSDDNYPRYAFGGGRGLEWDNSVFGGYDSDGAWSDGDGIWHL